jgi:hypothetical protein
MAKREFELLTSPDTVRVRVPVKQSGAFWLPVEDSEEVIEAVFKAMSFGDNLVIEKACTYRIDNKQTRERRDEVDINEMRRLIVKRNLLSWTLPIPIERENDWMTEECYRRVGSVSAPLMEALLDRYEERIQVSKEDEELIHRQSAILFSKNSRGVADACEAVSLFCTLGNYWEKFGLDRFTILNLPYREYLMLKMMIGKEGDAHRATSHAKPSGSKIVMGHRGRPMPSRATPGE